MEHTAKFIRMHFYTKALPNLDEAQQASYDILRTSLFDQIEPNNAIEHQLFEQLVHASWQLDRARALEDHALFQLTSEPDNAVFKRNYQAFLKNRRSLDFTISNALKELRRLIASRILAVTVDCHTLFTTETDARVPTLLDLQQTLPLSELRPNRNVLSISLARLKNPAAKFTPPQEILNRMQNTESAA